MLNSKINIYFVFTVFSLFVVTSADAYISQPAESALSFNNYQGPKISDYTVGEYEGASEHYDDSHSFEKRESGDLYKLSVGNPSIDPRITNMNINHLYDRSFLVENDTVFKVFLNEVKGAKWVMDYDATCIEVLEKSTKLGVLNLTLKAIKNGETRFHLDLCKSEGKKISVLESKTLNLEVR